MSDATAIGFGTLFRVSGSDKQGAHDYGGVYDALFPPGARAGVTAVLELGAGASLRAWAAAFPNATVLGLDANADAVATHHGLPKEWVSQANLDSRESIQKAVGAGTYDLVVDDGSHLLPHQLLAWAMLLPRVKPGGALVVEDVQSQADLDVLARLPGAEVFDRRASKRWDDVIVAFRVPRGESL